LCSDVTNLTIVITVAFLILTWFCSADIYTQQHACEHGDMHHAAASQSKV